MRGDHPVAAITDAQNAGGLRADGCQASGKGVQQPRRFLSLAADDHIGDLPFPGGRAYVGHDRLFHALGSADGQRPPDQRQRHYAASGNGASGTGTGAGSIRAGRAGSGRSMSSYMADRISPALRPGAELARARTSAYRSGA